MVAETAGLGELFGAAVAGTVTAEHQIFGRVGEVDELDDVDVVAFVLQDRCADGVGQQRREALLKQPVGEQNVEIAVSRRSGSATSSMVSKKRDAVFNCVPLF